MKKGIDVSEHNGTINFEKVKNAGYDFVIIRLRLDRKQRKSHNR